MNISVSIKFASMGILIFIAYLLLRDRRRDIRAYAGAAFLCSVAMYLGCNMLHGDTEHHPAILALLAGCFAVPFFFYLFSRSLFEDHFRPGVGHILLFLCIQIIGYVRYFLRSSLRESENEFALIFDLVPQILSLSLIVFAIARAYAGREADLVESRRQFRRFFVFGSGGYAVIVVAAELLLRGKPAPDIVDTLHSIMIASLNFYLGQRVVMIRSDALAPERKESGGAPTTDELDLQNRLQSVMEKERFYIQENLSVRVLASHLGVHEYKMRRFINGRLGFRNFNEFLNEYRIKEACAVLADPEKNDTPILRLAMELGYGSLAPFNRAFRVVTGKTPTEYRRAVLEKTA